jgi:hypothetical protein
VLDEARRRGLLSDEHVTVDGTLLESWASLKSFRPKPQAEAGEHQQADPSEHRGDDPPSAAGGRNPDVDFHGQKRSNATHTSTTDPDARLMRKGKGKEAKRCEMSHVLMENRNGLVVNVLLRHATGTAEREAVLRMLDRRPEPQRHRTVGADKTTATYNLVRMARIEVASRGIAEPAAA